MKNFDFKKFILIFKKELGHYLNNPSYYVLASIFLLICGYFYAQPLFLIGQANLNSLIEVAPLILSFFAPALSMRLIAEEKRTQTCEVLFTLPFTEEEIILGKYLSALFLMSISILLMFPYAATIMALGKPDIGHIIGVFVGLLLTSMLYLSAGIFASTLSSSQITAFIIGFAISFAFYILGKTVLFFPFSVQEIISYLGTDSHLEGISRGVIEFKDLIYYFSFSALFLYFSILRIKLWKK